MPTIQCSNCSKEIYKRPRDLKKSISGKVYCSSKCYGAGREPISNRVCPVCEKPMIGYTQRKTCSRSCANRQRSGIRYGVGAPNDKRLFKTRLKLTLAEQRGEMCERCGYDDFRIVVVHHKVERCNGGSDELDNLELLCPNCHALHHYVNSK